MELKRKNKCIKLDDEKPLPVARNVLWIEEQPCTTVTATNESIRLPAGLEGIGDENVVVWRFRSLSPISPFQSD
jgi:hypothetical protein